MKDRFYLACFRDNVGGNIAWHCKDGNGYSTNIDAAHVYTRNEAQQAWDRAREFDQPISADHVDANFIWKVDFQKVRENTDYSDGEQYVAYEKKRYDGNDLFWITDTLPSLDFSEAKLFEGSKIIEQRDVVYVPFIEVDKVKRRTFEFEKFNAKKMVQGAGLKLPDHIKRYRRRKPTSGKTRGNCPSCGKITWDYNPYENAHCNDCNFERGCNY